MQHIYYVNVCLINNVMTNKLMNPFLTLKCPRATSEKDPLKQGIHGFHERIKNKTYPDESF